MVAMAVHNFSLCFLSYACNLEALVVLGRLHILNGEHERIGLHFFAGGGLYSFFCFCFLFASLENSTQKWKLATWEGFKKEKAFSIYIILFPGFPCDIVSLPFLIYDIIPFRRTKWLCFHKRKKEKWKILPSFLCREIQGYVCHHHHHHIFVLDIFFFSLFNIDAFGVIFACLW